MPAKGSKRGFCRKGHDLSVVGVFSNKACGICYKEYRIRTRPQRRAYDRIYLPKWYKKNKKRLKIRIKNWYLVKNYNITLDEYNKMFEKQNGRCIGCSRLQEEVTYSFGVDHNHTCCKGKISCGKCIRGLLCINRNAFLGIIKDDIQSLKNLIKHLQKRNKKKLKSKNK